MNQSVATYPIRNVIIYLIVFCKNIFLPEKSNGYILEDVISYNNYLNIIIISIYFSESIKDSDVKFFHKLLISFQFVLFKFGIDNLEIRSFSAT